jgi:hypothetical protein
MRKQARWQLVLDLGNTQRHRPIEDTPEGLVEALADLLLEAFGKEARERASAKEAVDESQDHG